ncbi:MAG: aspartate carbamoyltransferase [Candidatus Paceibacterota bacterium]
MEKIKHILEVAQFSRAWLEKDLFPRAKEMENYIDVRLARYWAIVPRLMFSLFYEPSTRTRFSFESAFIKLGGSVVSTENAEEFSSAIKGETIEDTVRTLNGYKPDCIVMRSKNVGDASKAAAKSAAPVINAGDGSGEHPTQALLDVYTISKHFGWSPIDGLQIAMVGDLDKGRTVRSLSKILANWQRMKIYYVSPENARMRQDVKDFLAQRGVAWEEFSDLRDVAGQVNVIYQTRTQKERGTNFERGQAFSITKQTLQLMKPDTIILHPLPRNEEIAVEVDDDPRAKYFEQAENGLYVRMALLVSIVSAYDNERYERQKQHCP